MIHYHNHAPNSGAPGSVHESSPEVSAARYRAGTGESGAGFCLGWLSGGPSESSLDFSSGRGFIGNGGYAAMSSAALELLSWRGDAARVYGLDGVVHDFVLAPVSV